MTSGFHRCPRKGCQAQVSDSLFCCPDDWWDLPVKARKWVVKTAGLSILLPERRGAIEFARRCWNIADHKKTAD
jgi:hypothetical protein